MQKFIFLIASIIAICFNTLDVYKFYGGQSTTYISNNFASTIITPAGLTFAIRGIIFLMFLIVGIANIKNPSLISKNTLLYFVGSCTAITLWIVFFQLQVPFVPTILLLIILFFNLRVSSEISPNIKHFYLIYTSWTLIASVISITVMLQYDLGIKSLFGVPNPIMALLVLGIGVILFSFIAFHYQSITPLLVGAWAYFGISRVPASSAAFKTGSIAYAIILILIALGLIYKTRKISLERYYK
jgi:hypothetical protein